MTDLDTTPLPASKAAYSFDEATREYLGVVEVFLSPLEGQYFLPRNVVEVTPPESLGANERARLNADASAWDIVPDFRRCMLWDTDTCTPMPNTLSLGDVPPPGATADAPPVVNPGTPLMNIWDSDARAWRQLPDYSRTPVWSTATGERAVPPKPREPLPNTLTVVEPPTVGEHQAVQWNAQHNAWDIVADYRGFTYWTADGTGHAITELGIAPPADALTSPPTTPPDDVAA